MHYLKNQGAITNNVFGFYMATFTEQSSVDIGGFDSSKFKAGLSPTYLPIDNSFFWIINVNGFRIGLDNTF
jgi:hypothetical protein